MRKLALLLDLTKGTNGRQRMLTVSQEKAKAMVYVILIIIFCNLSFSTVSGMKVNPIMTRIMNTVQKLWGAFNHGMTAHVITR